MFVCLTSILDGVDARSLREDRSAAQNTVILIREDGEVPVNRMDPSQLARLRMTVATGALHGGRTVRRS